MEEKMNITLEEIIRRKIQFHQDNKILDTHENKGYIRGYIEILDDINMSEDDFINKYLKVLKSLDVMFENYDESKGNIDELSAYNNAIVDILRLLDEKYLYASSWDSDLDNL